MKVMLLCAAGMSSSILMKAIQKSIKKNDLDIEIKAFGADCIVDYGNLYDMILIAPQIAYRFDKLKEKCSTPMYLVDPTDYATANGDHVLNMILKKKSET